MARRFQPTVGSLLGRLLAAAGLVACAFAVLSETSEPSDATVRRAAPATAIAVSVAAWPSGRPVPHGFVGISMEYPSALVYFSRGAAAPFARLVRQLTPGGAPVIRVGGDTTDWTWWPARDVPRPPGVTFALTRRWLALTRAVAQSLHARLILGINLEAGSRALAASESRALLAGLGRGLIAGFELGNEPEVYRSMPWYHRASGQGVMGRPPGYGLAALAADYRRIGSALPSGVPLVGPSTGSTRWLARLPTFMDAVPRLRAVTVHRYPLRRCRVSVGSAAFPTIAHLLVARSASAPATALAADVAGAHARGLAFRVDELNSVSCKGARGVSDTFASALWAIDALFHMAAVGVDGVNVHAYPGPYEPFGFTRSGHRTVADVRPLFYGLLFFVRAAPPGSRMLATPHAPAAGLRTWATRSRSGVISVLAINELARRTLTIAVQSPARTRTARLERLLAPGLLAKNGVTIAGQRFGATARLTGQLTAPALAPVGGRYVVSLAPASAAILTLLP